MATGKVRPTRPQPQVSSIARAASSSAVRGYSVVVELDRDPDTGRRRQKWHSGYRTKRDAERALAELAGSVHTGTYVPKSRATVADLASGWLAAITSTVRPSTHYSYGRNLRLHVLPSLGSMPTAKVDDATLNALYARLLADGIVDLDTGRAAIRQTVIAVQHQVQFGDPKTAKGRRSVTLDRATVTALREHRRRQVAERLAMGAGFTEHGLVFCRPDGGPLHPERFSRTFGDRARQLGLPAIRLHDLRHSWATMALAAGVHPKVVQERLVHANIGITLDTYSHVTAALHADAAEQVAALVWERRLATR